MRNMRFKNKIALIFFISYAALSIYLIGFFYNKTIFLQKEQLREKLMQLSYLGTQIVPADLVDSIVPKKDSMGTEEYNVLVEKLRSINEVHEDIADVYVLVNTAKPGAMRFIGNADPEEVVECGEKYDVTRFPELMKASEGPTADHKIAQDKWGFWLSGYAPILRKNGEMAGILGIDVSAQTIAYMRNLIKRNAVYVFLLGIIFSLVVGNLVSWWLTKPLSVLVKGIDKIGSGDLDYKIDLMTKDEIGKVGESFNKMATELKKYIKDLTETTREKERLNRELEIAAELQKAMLPRYSLDIKSLDLAGLSLPAKQVGGDYFDYFNTVGKNIGFVIADATGKGLPSSIFMTNSKSIFKVISTEEMEPSKVIKRTNDLVIRDISPSTVMFVTLFYGVYDRDSKIFRYTNAGHNPPLYIDNKNSTIKMLNTHGCPVGIVEDQEYGEDEIKLEEGDVIILYTDGVIEAINKDREMFGIQRLMELAMENKELAAQEIVDKIKEEVFAFTDSPEQFDDFTILTFKVK